MRSREMKERRIQHGIQKSPQCFLRAPRKVPIVGIEFKGGKVTIAQPSVREAQLPGGSDHICAHAVVATSSGRFVLIVESTTPDFVVAPDDREHVLCLFSQADHLLFEHRPEPTVSDIA